jgi:CubicO group peptidase (beta-lactamase class C family)
VSRDWVARATAPHVSAPDSSSDGYAWHLHTIGAAGRVWRSYEASGNGGQLAIVVPELGLVVAFTGGNYNQQRVWRRFREELLPHVIAAAKDR